MGLAPFFEKAALAGSHLLQEFDRNSFRQVLEARTIGIAFDEEAATSAEGQVTMELAVNLLARLYPRLALEPIGDVARMKAEPLVSLAKAINPDIDISLGPSDASVCLVVGETRVENRANSFYLGSDGWVAALSTTTPVNSADSDNPFGASAAACFGAANVFRTVFAGQLKHAAPDRELRVSLLNLDQRAGDLPNPRAEVVDLRESHLAGVGAIGNAAVWALARAPFLRGTLHLVDHEAVDDTNPQRYALTTMADIGTAKVTLAKRVLENSLLCVEPHVASWGQYLRRRSDWHLERVAVALDTAEDRCAVQVALPQWIVNAWTQPEDLGASRHSFIDDQACLMCLYMPGGTVPDFDDQMVSALNLPADDQTLRAVRELLVTDAPIGPEWIKKIATANQVPVEPLLALQDLPIHAFYQRAVCGGIMMALGAGTDESHKGGAHQAEVPMAFQSALAGVLLASELVAQAAGYKGPPPPVTTKINLLKPLGTDLSLPEPKHHTGKCICQDPIYISSYRRKYSSL